MNPATGQPYSTGLPDCRAYEMVSPLYKQGYDALPVNPDGVLVTPDGSGAGFRSEGDFGEPENFNQVGFHAQNRYVARRGSSGWIASPAMPPASLRTALSTTGFGSDFSPDLSSAQATCGPVEPSKTQLVPTGLACVSRKLGGSWTLSPFFETPANTAISSEYLGGSSDLSRLYIQAGKPLLPADNLLAGTNEAGIYEITRLGTGSPTLRLVNVNSEETEELIVENPKVGPPLLGDRLGIVTKGSDYHAISANGETAFFTATLPATKKLAVFARVHCPAGAPSPCKEDGNGEWLKTVVVSAQSSTGCTIASCTASQPADALYQGASADGSKVFFTTSQELLNSDTDATPDLYEYEFNPNGDRLIQISQDPTPLQGAEVQGVVRASTDGSHIYFVAKGVLTSVANKNGETATLNQLNLYGYDTATSEIKFVGTATGDDYGPLSSKTSGDDARHAQTTPDGRYLVFSTSAVQAGDTNTGVAAKAVYRYDFVTGELTWVSRSAPGFQAKEGKAASIASLPASRDGAEVDVDDWNRALSSNGEFIIFSTSEALQAGDVNNSSDVYEWHNGIVGMVSDGRDPGGVQEELSGGGGGGAGISESGSDIFFFTHTRLVGQDTDIFKDLYDARVGGGFPAPPPEPSCPPGSEGGCQGKESSSPSFSKATSSQFAPGGNLVPTLHSVLSVTVSHPKPLTDAQQLAVALKACKGKPKGKRAACESQARKRYKAKRRAEALKACKGKPKNKRAVCEAQARKRYK